MADTNNTNTNTMTKEQRIAKAAEYQAKRLENATTRYESAKVYEAKKTGETSEGLREAKSNRISSFSVEGLAKACVARVNELTKTRMTNSVVRYLKKEVANLVTSMIDAEHLPLYVHTGLGVYKIDAAIKYVCSSSRNEAMKGLLKDLKKASK